MSYDYSPPTGELENLPAYLEQELGKIQQALNEPPKYTAEQFRSKGSYVNGRAKSEGVPVWDSTSKRPVWPTGDGAEATWIFGDGLVAYSPV